MTPKEKAKESVDRFMGFTLTDYKDLEMQHDLYKAKKHALICVDEKKKLLEEFMEDDDFDLLTIAVAYNKLKELEEVKQEIERI